MVDNPFNGRCIHGMKGAKFEKGTLLNRACEKCKKQHPSFFRVQDRQEEFVGSRS